MTSICVQEICLNIFCGSCYSHLDFLYQLLTSLAQLASVAVSKIKIMNMINAMGNIRILPCIAIRFSTFVALIWRIIYKNNYAGFNANFRQFHTPS